MSKYCEIHYSCMPEHVSIDAWLTTDDAEEGVVIARIDYMHKKNAQWNLEFLGLHEGEE